MSTITVEGVYDNGIIKSINKIKDKPKKIYILLDYGDKKQQEKKEIINLKNLVGVIKDDYKDDYKDFLFNKYS